MNALRRFFVASVLLSLGSMSAALAASTVLEIDQSHSTVGFGVKHLMVSTVNGSFTDFAGKLETSDANDLSKGKFEVTIKATSINTANTKRDEHLRSPDFFDVAKFPELKYVSEKITKTGKDKYKVVGQLTMHGVTKAVELEVSSFGKMKDPWGNEKYGFSATGKLNRKDFGLTWNKTLESGGLLVGEEVALNLGVEAGAPAAK